MQARSTLVAAAAMLLGLVACGGTEAASDASPPDASAEASDAPIAPDASIACGSSTCGAGEYCVSPCCGGAAPQCLPELDGGGCPPGTTFGQCLGGGSGFVMGCSMQCKPPPPFCSKVPMCPQGQFPMPEGQTVRCQCA